MIVAGARTPIGKLSGALASLTAADLGGVAIKAAMERAGVTPDQIDYVYMGQVIQAGQGQQNARAAAVNAGIGMDVPSATINKVCLSGLNTILLADQLIQSGYADIVVAGGMESMTNAPHVVSGLRSGIKLGDGTLVDSMMHDALTCTFDQCAMGASTEKYMSDWAELITREGQDAAAAKSGDDLVKLGFALATGGESAKGIAMMQQGIAKGGLKRPDDAKLHLGVAQVIAGDGKAQATLKSVGGTDGTADLARLWSLYARRKG